MKTKSIFKNAAMTALVVAMLIGGAMTAQAAGWQRNDIGWWYGTNADNTTWYANEWQWIDGNGDGIAECYCFDGNGYMYENTTTPDGYTVDANGAWTVDGVVQTKIVGGPGYVGGNAGGSTGGSGSVSGGSGSSGGSSGGSTGGSGSSTNENNTTASTATNNASDLQVLNGTYRMVEEVTYGEVTSQESLDMLNQTFDVKILENGDLQITGHSDLFGDANPSVYPKTGDREWTRTIGNQESIYTFPDNDTLKITDYMRKRYLGEYQGYCVCRRVN